MDDLREATLEEVKRFITFKNPNNFDEYFSKVLPNTNINYSYVSKYSVFTKIGNVEKKQPVKRIRKKLEPKRRDYVLGITNEIPDLNHLSKNEIEQKNNYIDNFHKDKKSNSLIKLSKSSSNNSLNKKNLNTNLKKTNISQKINKRENISVEDKITNLISNRNHDKIVCRKTLNQVNINNNFNNINSNLNRVDFNTNTDVVHFNEIQEDTDSEFLNCMICAWVYPIHITPEEKNAHLNFCLEGKGEKHKKDYMSNLKAIDLTVHNSNNWESTQIKNENIIGNNCPNCGKIFNLKSQKFKEKHLSDCYRDSDQFILSNDRKRKINNQNSN